jgi:hypothetical protein
LMYMAKTSNRGWVGGRKRENQISINGARNQFYDKIRPGSGHEYPDFSRDAGDRPDRDR